jgi:hypothetical protein
VTTPPVLPPMVVMEPMPMPMVDRSLRAFVKTPAGQASIVVGAAGVVSLIAAAALGATVLSAKNDYMQGCNAGRCDQGLYDSAHGKAIGTDVLIGIGAAAVVTSVVLLAVRPGLAKHAARTPLRLNAANLTVSF